MYARFLTFKARPEQREQVEALANSMVSVMQSLHGFVDLHYLVSDDGTDYASLSFWASKDDAQAAGELLCERVLGRIEGLASEPPKISVYKIYEPPEELHAKAS
jgi:quinol monooxygenase YgiN